MRTAPQRPRASSRPDSNRAAARRPRAPLWTALAAALLATAAPAAAQEVVGTVVAADDGRPLPDVLVVLYGPDALPVDSARTDSVGGFRLDAVEPGEHRLHVEPEGHLTLTEFLTLEPVERAVRRIEMPLISTGAAANIRDIIEREATLQLPLEELCREPLRPWEAGLLVGMARDRRTGDPVAGVALEVTPLGGEVHGPGPAERTARSGTATAAGVYWFCNLPEGRARVVARRTGFRPDTSYATIRAGTVSWYDVLLRRPGS